MLHLQQQNQHFCLPVQRDSICKFLCHIFLSSSKVGEITTVSNIISLLQKIPNVARTIYNRPWSPKALVTKYLHMTILQIINSLIIDIQLSDEKPAAILSLTIDNKSSSPNYMYDSVWTRILLVDTSNYINS